MLPLLLCFLLLIGLPAETQANRVSVPVNANITTLSLEGFLYASPAGHKLETPEEALALYRQGGFERLPANLGRGYRKEVVWLAFQLDAGPQTPRILIADVSPAYLDEVRAYQVTNSGTLQLLGRAGDQVPLAETLLHALRPAFAIRPNEGTTILLAIRTTSTQAAIVKLHAGGRYPALQSAEGLLFGTVFAINLIMGMGALALYLLFRERAYLVWLLYVLVTCAQWVSLDGLLHLYYPWQDLSNLNLLTNVLSIILFALGGLLMTILFQFNQIHPWLHRIFVGWAAFMVLPLMAIPFGGAWVVGLLAQIGLPLFLLGMLGIVLQMLRGHRASRLYGPMFLIHLAASLVNILAIVGLCSFSETTLYGWQLTSFLNLISLQVSMFMRMRESLQAHARDRILLMDELSRKNAELEHQVTQRTASLSQALRDVQQAESEQRQLLSMASHEFRTPAAMIKSSLDSLRFLHHQIPQEVARRLNNIELASARLTRLSNTLIHQDRLRELALHPRLAPVDLQALMHEVAAHYPPAADATPPPVLLETATPLPPPDATTTLADPALISIALHNLIDNALQHGGADNHQATNAIRLSLETGPDHLELRVADRGPGIPDDDKSRIFERFHTLTHKTATELSGPARTHGDGLGLSIVRAIVLAHGGSAYASDNPGGGAILALRLPRKTETPPPVE